MGRGTYHEDPVGGAGNVNRNRRRSHRWQVSVISAAVLMVVMGSIMGGLVLVSRNPSRPGQMTSLFVRPASGTASNILSTEQVITVGQTTVRLVSVVPSASQTVIELVIEDPFIAPGSPPTFIPPRGRNLLLEGFATTEVQRSASASEPGRQRHVMDLAPFSEPGGKAVLEIPYLIRRNPETRRQEQVQGPWRFEFDRILPLVAAFEKRFVVDKALELDGVTVALTSVHLSDSETVVEYRIESSPDTFLIETGVSWLEYDGNTYKGQGKGPGSTSPSDRPHVVAFPALPRDVREFKISVPPPLVARPNAAELTLELPSRSGGGTYALDQVVQVGSALFRFTSLTVLGGQFELLYEPANEAASWLALVEGPPPWEDAIDDLGNTYEQNYFTLSGSRAEGKKLVFLASETLRFSGSLAPAASQLTLRFSRMGFFGSQLFEFTVEVPE